MRLPGGKVGVDKYQEYAGGGGSPTSDVIEVAHIRRPEGSLTLAIAADGHASDSLAAREFADRGMAVLVRAVKEAPGRSVPEILRGSLEAALDALAGEGHPGAASNGASPSLTVAAVHDGTLFLAYAGSNRVYLVRNGQPRQLTVHADRAAQPAWQRRPPGAEVSTTFHSFSGNGASIDRLPLVAGDYIVVCSDGLVGGPFNAPGRYVTSREIAEAASESNLKKMAQRLVGLAKSRDVDDDISVIVMHYAGSGVNRRYFGMAAVTLLAAAAVTTGVLLASPKQQPAPSPTALMATPVLVDAGTARLEAFTGSVSYFNPGSEGLAIASGPVDIRTGGRLQTAGGTATVIVPGARVYLDENTTIEFVQLEPKDPVQRGRVILSLTSGRLLIKHESSTRTFTIDLSENIQAQLNPGERGAIGLTVASGTGAIDCLVGACEAHAGGARLSLLPGQTVPLAGAVLGETERLQAEAAATWATLCPNCALPEIVPDATPTGMPTAVPATWPAPTPQPAVAATLPADVKALAVVVIEGKKTAPLLRTPGSNGAFVDVLTDGMDVQVLNEPYQTIDGVVWVKIRIDNGNFGWTSESLLAISPILQPQ